MPGWRKFGGVRSHGCKSFILRWAARMPFTRVWIIENDVFFTGRWNEIFDSAHPTADVVADFTDSPTFMLPMANGEDAMELQDRLLRSRLVIAPSVISGCRVAAGVPCIVKRGAEGVAMPMSTAVAAQAEKGGIAIGKGTEAMGPHRKVMWMTIRLSRPFAQRLAGSLSRADGARGHHEAVTGPFGIFEGFSMEHLPSFVLSNGTFVPGGWGALKRKRSPQNGLLGLARLFDPNGRIHESSLYHPVKCAADSRAGQLQLAWARAKADASSILAQRLLLNMQRILR